jgi:hypothetical protein
VSDNRSRFPFKPWKVPQSIKTHQLARRSCLGIQHQNDNSSFPRNMSKIIVAYRSKGTGMKGFWHRMPDRLPAAMRHLGFPTSLSRTIQLLGSKHHLIDYVKSIREQNVGSRTPLRPLLANKARPATFEASFARSESSIFYPSKCTNTSQHCRGSPTCRICRQSRS